MAITDVLKEIEKDSLNYSELHKKESIKLTKKNKIISISNIILLSFTTLSELIIQIDTTFGSKIYATYSILRLILLFFSTFLSSIIHLLNYEKTSQLHLKKANSYFVLSNSIKRELLLEQNDYKNFYGWISKNWSNLLSSEPSIPGNSVTNVSNDKLTTEIELNNVSVDDTSTETRYQLERHLYNND